LFCLLLSKKSTLWATPPAACTLLYLWLMFDIIWFVKGQPKKRNLEFLLILVEILENQTPNQVVLCPNHGDINIIVA
jgi:hypothetical protein